MKPWKRRLPWEKENPVLERIQDAVLNKSVGLAAMLATLANSLWLHAWISAALIVAGLICLWGGGAWEKYKVCKCHAEWREHYERLKRRGGDPGARQQQRRRMSRAPGLRSRGRRD
jgi:hypothetical protein